MSRYVYFAAGWVLWVLAVALLLEALDVGTAPAMLLGMVAGALGIFACLMADDAIERRRSRQARMDQWFAAERRRNGP